MAKLNAAANMRNAANNVAAELRRRRQHYEDTFKKAGAQYSYGKKDAFGEALDLLEEAGVIDPDPAVEASREEAEKARYRALLEDLGASPKDLAGKSESQLRNLHEILSAALDKNSEEGD